MAITSLKMLGVALLAILPLAFAAPQANKAPPLPDFSAAEIESGAALRKLSQMAYDNALARAAKATTGCTKDTVKIRKEWRNMTLPDRKGYQEAVTCLMKLPSRNKGIDGAKTAWDDYGVLHYKQTPYVHNSATFLAWHRHLNWVLEEDLKTNCGYTGVFPYWEWGLDCGNVEKSPVFDGSEYSLGSNGVFVPGHQGAFPGVPAGSGGGCISKTGPFGNLTVNMGPFTASDPLKYNPQCFQRDLNGALCKRWASLRNTTFPLLNGQKDMETFQAILEADTRFPAGRVDGGVHGGGHFTISGFPGGDMHFSALEPGFYLHHGNIDRLWFMWQNLDWANRQGIMGTNTMFNKPPTPEAVLSDPMRFEPIHRDNTIANAIDTVGGNPLCYVYAPW